MIPRTIHQVWIGPYDPPSESMDGWRLPGWEYRVWRDDDLARLPMRARRFYDHLYEQERWSGAVDIARVEILAEHGGVYIDADTEMVQPLDDAPFMAAPMWAVEQPYDDGMLANGYLACVPGHPAMAAYRDALATLVPSWRPLLPRTLHPLSQKTGKTLLTSVAAGRDDVVVVPAGAFIQHDQDGTEVEYDGPVYGSHWWGTTRGDYPSSVWSLEGGRLRQIAAESATLKRLYHRVCGTEPAAKRPERGG